MELSKQTVSLELAKKLKELGVEQVSHFNWFNEFFGDKEEWRLDCSHRWANDEKFKTYSAFTTSELGEMLPWYFSSEKHTNDWRAGFLRNDAMETVPVFSADTEADCRAKMLIYLIEHDLLPTKE